MRMRWVIAMLGALAGCADVSARAVAGAAPAADTSAAGKSSASSADARSRLCEYGITLAFQGRLDAADSAFVSLLSRSPGDARALNNLGNLRLWRGQPQEALSFYRAAGVADTADAGILLNAAAAFAMLGDDESSRAVAAEGVARAGGVAPAAELLGIGSDVASSDSGLGADRTRMSREQALQMLRSAARAVPSDSLGRAAGDTARAGTARAPTWRSAGARGSDESGPAAIVYWKH